MASKKKAFGILIGRGDLSPICEVSIKEKMTEAPFPRRVGRSYTDVCDPTRSEIVCHVYRLPLQLLWSQFHKKKESGVFRIYKIQKHGRNTNG